MRNMCAKVSMIFDLHIIIILLTLAAGNHVRAMNAFFSVCNCRIKIPKVWQLIIVLARKSIADNVARHSYLVITKS
jgi:hypothetical protein